MIMALMAYAGDTDAEQRPRAVSERSPSRSRTCSKPMPYPEGLPAGAGGHHPVAITRTMFVDHIGRAEAETILDHLEASTATSGGRPVGGGGAAPDAGRSDGSGAGRRDGVRAPHEPDHGQRRRDLRGGPTRARCTAHGSMGSPAPPSARRQAASLPRRRGRGAGRAAYPGATWDRLRQIEAHFDPTNLFHLNQNIPPAAA